MTKKNKKKKKNKKNSKELQMNKRKNKYPIN